jgi:vacuolar iron transporter family protein
VAGSIAMGLGGYLAGRTEVEHYDSELKREFEEVKRVPELEKKEVKEVFASYGLDEDSQKMVVDILSKSEEKWVNFMMKFELGLEKPNINRARNSALTIGVAYMVGGIIPLSPYFLVSNAQTGLLYSVVLTLITLFIFGYFKSKVTGQNPIFGAFKVTLIGAVAAGAAFFVARLFG